MPVFGVHRILLNRDFLYRIRRRHVARLVAEVDRATVNLQVTGVLAAAANFLAVAGVQYNGNIIITGISLSVAVDGVASATFTFQGSGHIEIAGVTTTAP